MALHTKVPLSRVRQCTVCGEAELTKQAELPDNWVLLWDYPVVLCDKCIERWQERFNEKPVLWMTGGEELI